MMKLLCRALDLSMCFASSICAFMGGPGLELVIRHVLSLRR